MVSKKLTKFKIIFKQNLIALFVVLTWFGFNFFYFFITTGMDFSETAKIVFFFKEGPGEYGYFYDSFTEFIIFGLIFSLITVELFRKYNPAVTSREISKKYEDHAVIIGYSHMGRRIANYFDKQGIKYVIVEKNFDLVEDLIANEEPVINDTALSIQTLEDAGVKKAKAVYVMADNLELQMVVNYNVRQLNPKCRLIDRIFQDDIGDLISKTYNAEIISTSKYASNIILNKVRNGGFNYILLIGMNHISARLMRKFQKRNIKYRLIEEDEEKLEEMLIETDDPNVILGDPKELSSMEKANINDVDYVVNLNPDVTNSVLITKHIRDLNSNCKMICRIFLDSVAEILEKPPFNSEILSSTKATLSYLIEKGMLDF